MTTVALPGCTPEPLAAYLRSLAVLRLVAEQKDPSARGYWKDDVFHLETTLDLEALMHFFLSEYAPTPFVGPWNGGSGFYAADDMTGIDAISASSDPRFGPYRETISAIRSWPEMPQTIWTLGAMLARADSMAAAKAGNEAERLRALGAAVRAAMSSADSMASTIEQVTSKPLLKLARKLRTAVTKDERATGKEAIILACRDRLGSTALEWIDAAVVIGADRSLAYPPLAGSAGNEGRLDYTSAFMRMASELLLGTAPAGAALLLRHALLGETTGGMVTAAVGQHDPGRAGGYNQGLGIETESPPVNPWSFMLALEGLPVWASGVARRQGDARGVLCTPFAGHARAVGYSSSAGKDTEGARTAEVWAPLWPHPTGYPELRAFFAEGRAEVGRRRASNGIEFAQAASSLGVDRGVTAFVRYGLLKRRGDSYVALPVGRFPVRVHCNSDLLRQLEKPLGAFDRFLSGYKEPPARLAAARNGIDAALYDALLHGGAPTIKSLVASIGRAEGLLAVRDPARKPILKRPLGGLDPHWALAADDGTVEVRLARALASMTSLGKVGPLRANLAPVDPAKPWEWGHGAGQRAWSGSSLCARLAGVLSRRLLDAERLGCEANPLQGGLTVDPADAGALASGRVDEALLEELLFGFLWVDWANRDAVRAVREELSRQPRTPAEPVPRTFALLKLLFLPGPVPGHDDARLRPEPSILALLGASRIGDACEVARRRLRAAGLSPMRARFPDGEDGTRLAAALLLPVGRVAALARLVLLDDKDKD